RRGAEVLELYRQLGNAYAVSASLYAAAGLAVAAGDPERALRLCGAAASERDAIRAPLAPRWEALAQATVVEPARAALDPARADAAWAAGARLSLDEAVAYAPADPATAQARAEGTCGGDGGTPTRAERAAA